MDGARGRTWRPAERVEDPAAFAYALHRAFDQPQSLLDVVLSLQAVSSGARKDLGFVPDDPPLTVWDKVKQARRGDR